MKIRTDFVTNSSSSSFVLEISFIYRSGEKDTASIQSGFGDGYPSNTHFIEADLSAKQLGKSKNIQELIKLMNKSILLDNESVTEHNRSVAEYKSAVKKLEDNANMNKIKKVMVSSEISDQNFGLITQKYLYDISDGSYVKCEKGSASVSEGFTGELNVPDSNEAVSVENIGWQELQVSPEKELNDYLYAGNAESICGDSTVVIPETVKMIDCGAFDEHQEIKEIVIGKSVEKIAGGAFNCAKLKKITVDTANPHYYVTGNALMETATSTLVCIIDRNAEEIVFPKETESVASYALWGSTATNIKVPDFIKELRFKAFAGCKKLETVEFTDSLSKIGEQLFGGRRKVSVKAPDKSFAMKYAVKHKIPLSDECLSGDSEVLKLYKGKNFALIGFSKRTATTIQNFLGTVGAAARNAVNSRTNYAVFRSEEDFKNENYQKALQLIAGGQEIIILNHNDFKKMQKSNKIPPQDRYRELAAEIAGK